MAEKADPLIGSLRSSASISTDREGRGTLIGRLKGSHTETNDQTEKHPNLCSDASLFGDPYGITTAEQARHQSAPTEREGTL